MNDKRKSAGRRNTDRAAMLGDAITIVVNGKLNSSSAEVERAVAEINKGHSVIIARKNIQISKKRSNVAIRSDQKGHDGLSFGEIATILSGGAALGLTSLALAPASMLTAGLAAVVGVGLSGVLSKKLDQIEN